MSGKTNLAKQLAQKTEQENKSVVVYDPTRSPGWPKTAKKFSEPNLFLERINKLSSALVFVDEAKTLWDCNEAEADALVYKGRHRGFLCVLIAQRTRMVPPNARNQCSRVFAFRQNPYDAETLAAEYHPALLSCSKLAEGEFIYTDGFRAISGKLDYSAGLPPTPIFQKTFIDPATTA